MKVFTAAYKSDPTDKVTENWTRLKKACFSALTAILSTMMLGYAEKNIPFHVFKQVLKKISSNKMNGAHSAALDMRAS